MNNPASYPFCRIESESKILLNNMLEHQASNFWKRLLRCRSKQLVITWKIASFFEKSRRLHFQKACSIHLLRRKILNWQRKSSKSARNKGWVIDFKDKSEKNSVRRMVIAWRRVCCCRAIAVVQLRKKVELVLLSDVVRKWLLTNLKNAFLFRNFSLCAKKFMLITQRTAFVGWMTLCKMIKASFMEQRKDEAQELLRIRRSDCRNISGAFSSWSRFIRQSREFSSKSQHFKEIKSAYWPIRIQRHCLSIWFVATQNRTNGTSFKHAIMMQGKKVFLSRKSQEILSTSFYTWKRFQSARLRARNDLERSRLFLMQKHFDCWVAFTCRESLLSLKSNGLVQRNILVRRFSKVGIAGRAFFRWRHCALKMRRKRRFAVFVSRLFKKGEKNMLVSHFLVWSCFCKNECEKRRINIHLQRKIFKLWKIECKIRARQRRLRLGHSLRAWITFASDRSFLQLRAAVKVLLRVLSRRNPCHISFAIETGILKSKSSFKVSAFKPFCTWAMFVQMRRHSSSQLSIFFGKWKALVRCSVKIRSAVDCASNSYKRSISAMLKHVVDQFFVSMMICSSKFAKDARTNRVLLFNGIFEHLRFQKQRLSFNMMSKNSRLVQIFEYWKSFSSRNAIGKWLSLQLKMQFAVQRLRSWARRKRICDAANRFLNRVSRSALSFVISLWKHNVFMNKKRMLDTSAIRKRLVRTACQRLLSATVTAWRLLAVSKSKIMPATSGSQLPLSFSAKRSSARRDAIWKDLNSSSHDSESS
jgi:hypothetical protein